MSTFANPLTEYSPQMETFESPELSFPGESGGVFSAHEEMDLASELLDVSSEEELDQFLGDLISKAGKAIGKFVKSPVGQAIGGVLKKVAKVGLPIAAGAVGTFLGGPVGSMIGSSLASAATNALGLELEGLSPEDREFEAAKHFVRFAGEAVKNALEAPPASNPVAVAQKAVTDAARLHAPGLVNIAQTASGYESTARESGTWIRHQGKIILFGI